MGPSKGILSILSYHLYISTVSLPQSPMPLHILISSILSCLTYTGVLTVEQGRVQGSGFRFALYIAQGFTV